MTALSEQDRAFVIRCMNDEFRASFTGGIVTLSAGVAALSGEVRAEVLCRVRNFKHFTKENNPHGENDFGSFKIADTVFAFKIDYYDKDMEHGSEDPTDPTRTTRVMTILRLDEY
jgi:hypothetical protein